MRYHVCQLSGRDLAPFQSLLCPLTTQLDEDQCVPSLVDIRACMCVKLANISDLQHCVVCLFFLPIVSRVEGILFAFSSLVLIVNGLKRELVMVLLELGAESPLPGPGSHLCSGAVSHWHLCQLAEAVPEEYGGRKYFCAGDLCRTENGTPHSLLPFWTPCFLSTIRALLS